MYLPAISNCVNCLIGTPTVLFRDQLPPSWCNQRFIAPKKKSQRDNNSRTCVITENVCRYVSRLDMWCLTQRLARSTNIVLQTGQIQGKCVCLSMAQTLGHNATVNCARRYKITGRYSDCLWRHERGTFATYRLFSFSHNRTIFCYCYVFLSEFWAMLSFYSKFYVAWGMRISWEFPIQSWNPFQHFEVLFSSKYEYLPIVYLLNSGGTNYLKNDENNVLFVTDNHG